jgi:hypothetical protein
MTSNFRLLVAAAMALFSLSAVASTTAAGVGALGKAEGVTYQQHAGITTQQALDLLAAVAEDGTFAIDLETRPEFQAVFDLHYSSPDLFEGDADTADLTDTGRRSE